MRVIWIFIRVSCFGVCVWGLEGCGYGIPMVGPGFLEDPFESDEFMHELSLTRNIVSIVTEKSKGAKIRQVTLEIGKFSAVLPDALQFCFDIVTKGTVAEGADLEIIETPGIGKMRGMWESI